MDRKGYKGYGPNMGPTHTSIDGASWMSWTSRAEGLVSVPHDVRTKIKYSLNIKQSKRTDL